jgi:peptidoglycan/LPS O-acetylase OafA/YrhL
MPLISNFRYRPEIDGLRAIAVMAVVLFHAGLGVTGGFIGVDVFFVISGFLITSLILKDLEAGKFSFTNFWERRARRIIPAAVVLVLAVLVAGWFLLLPSDYAALGKSATMHAAFAANFYFWRNTNYFAGSAEEQPLLHTWSLAVEEQFYLFVPLLLFGIFLFPALRRRGVLLAIFLIGFVISLALSIALVPRMPAVAFYLLPTRAWEMLGGSIIAILPAVTMSRWLREILCLIALAAILVPCFLYSKETSFPGLAALPPCLGAALFIWASGSAASEIQNSKLVSAEHCGAGFKIQNLLASRPLVFIGLISYSLYLWHWPLFAFSTYWALEPMSLGYRLTLVAASFVLAILSWRFVETPFRKRTLGGTRGPMFIWAGGGLAISAACALVLVTQLGFPERFSDRVLAIDAAKNEALHENRITKAVTVDDALNGRFPRLGAADPAPVQLLVWGDSHARSILPAADALAREHALGVLTAWHSSTPPVLGYVPDARFAGFSLGKDCPVFNQAVLDHVARHRVPAVLLAARWSGYFEAETDPGLNIPQGSFAKGLLETVRQLKSAGATPYILMEVPNHKVPVPKALLAREILGTDLRPYAGTPPNVAERNREMARLIPDLTAAGARLIDVSDRLFDADSEQYRMDHVGVALYYDNHHLTRHGAVFVRDLLAPMLHPVSRETSHHSPTLPANH